jgi:hypothetical protein
MRLRWLGTGLLVLSALLFAQAPLSVPQSSPSLNEPPADEPGRAVARLGILNGDASVRRGDSTDWVAAAVNAPLMSGDELSVSPGGRAEVQFDAAHFVRIAGDSDLRLTDMENGHFLVQMPHGMITWRVLRDSKSQAEISTPLVSVHPGRQSVVRVEVSFDGATRITVRRGEADVSTQKGAERVHENSTMIVRGAVNEPEFQIVAAGPHDEWDNWNDQRDTYLTRAQSPRYVTEDVYGIEDLDSYGRWNYDPSYGWVWAPTVAASWAPYHDGHWVWEDYYGWTWVDYAPWGWAPFHYGYWYNRVGFGWSWYPGPHIGHTWWRPAMVGFFGWGAGFGVSFGYGNIGWCALAPYEIYRPWYGHGGWGGHSGGVYINVVHNTNIYNTYRNAGAVNGVTAVTAADFGRGNFRNNISVDRATLQQASMVNGVLPLTPNTQNLRFSDRTGSVQPPRTSAAVSNPRFSGGAAANAGGAQRTPFVQQQAAVRSALITQGPPSAGQGAARVQSQAPLQAQPQSQNQARPAVQSRSGIAGWQRFDSGAGANAGQVPRSELQSGSTPGWNRFGGPQGGGSQSVPQVSPRDNLPSQRGVQPMQQRQSQPVQPRQYLVAPPIVRQRQAAPDARQSYQPPVQPRTQQPQYYGPPSQPRMQQQPSYGPPAQPRMQQQAPPQSQGGGYRGGASPQQSAPAGGNRQTSGGHQGRR